MRLFIEKETDINGSTTFYLMQNRRCLDVFAHEYRALQAFEETKIDMKKKMVKVDVVKTEEI